MSPQPSSNDLNPISKGSKKKEREEERKIIENELNLLSERIAIIGKAWDLEVELYEEGLKQHSSLEMEHIDPRIFPYHKQCILLMDMYSGIDPSLQYHYDSDDNMMNAMGEQLPRTEQLREQLLVRVNEYLPCSASTIVRTLLPTYRSPVYKETGKLALTFEDMSQWEAELTSEKHDWILECYRFDTYEDAQQHHHHQQLQQQFQQQVHSKEHDASDEHLKPMIQDIRPKGLCTKVLLKLLKHSMSELQRDHHLSRALVLSMVENKCFSGGNEGVEALRYFLLTFLSEYIYDCNGNCHATYVFHRTGELYDESSDDDEEDDDNDENPRPTHYCNDYRKLVLSIQYVICNGIDFMTENHANLIVGFVHHLYDCCDWKEVDHMKELIGYMDDENINHADKPHKLLLSLISGLGIKAYEDRSRLKTLLRWKFSSNGQVSQSLMDEIKTVTQSHLITFQALVRIGKTTLKRLPADTVTEHIGSRIVRYLVMSSMDLIPHAKFSDFQTYLCVNMLEESMMNEHRYSNGINSFALEERKLQDIKKSFLDMCSYDQLINDESIRKVFLAPPSATTQHVVKGMFLRQLVDVDYSGCGYGDFLVWCRLPIHIYEPMLYEHIVNYPPYTDEAEEEDVKIKYLDEDGTRVIGDRLRARYDFSLLNMKRIWSKPWHPRNHGSFQKPYRDAVWTLLLCGHRYNLGPDVPQTVCSFLPRNWWLDDRLSCWRYECEIDNTNNLLNGNVCTRTKTLVVCNDCKTAHACSTKHLAMIHRDGHRRACKIPPIRQFNSEDEVFCQEMMSSGHTDPAVENSIDEDTDDDDSCWESIGSEENSNVSKTDVIHRYFEGKSYKLQRMEEPAFAAFYTDE